MSLYIAEDEIHVCVIVTIWGAWAVLFVYIRELGQIVLLLYLQFHQLKEIGNGYFTQGMYSEALGTYLQALNCCCEPNMKEQMALIQSYCAMTCLELQMYSDAYLHSMEYVKMNAVNDKVGILAVCLFIDD